MFRYPPYRLIIICLLLIPALGKAQQSFVLHGFVENKGQIVDQNGQPNPNVIAAYFSTDMDILLNKDGFSYQMKKSSTQNLSEESGLTALIDFHRIDVVLENANVDVDIDFLDGSNDVENYLTEFGNFYGVRRFNRVVYKNIYDGVDLEFIFADQGKDKSPVKFNFILQQASLLPVIQMRYLGQNDIQYNTALKASNPVLDISTGLGKIEEELPYSFLQMDGKHREVKVNYNLVDDGLVTYVLDNASSDCADMPLVVDPTPSITWSSYFGGSGVDQCNASLLDGTGYLYMAGSSNSASGIATTGVHQSAFGGGAVNDMFIAKFDLNGNRVWSTYLGASGDDQLFDLAVDASANIYFTGSSGSTTAISTAGVYQTANAGQSDAVVGKFNPAGVLQWCSYFGGALNEMAYGIAISGSDVFIVGSAVSTSGIASAGASQTTYGGGTADGFLARFDNAGARVWSTYFGGTGTDILRDVSVDSGGNILMIGYTSSTSGIATAGTHQVAHAGVNDGFLAAYTPSGLKNWCTYFGGSLSDIAFGVGVSATDEIAVCGYTYSTTGIATAGAFDTANAGAGDGFVIQFDNSGLRLWGSYFGGTGTENAYAISIDGTDNIHVVGNTSSTSSIATASAQQTSFGGGLADGFMMQFSGTGALNWATYLGGSGDDYLRAVDVDEVQGAFATGFSNSASGISTAGAHQTSLASAGVHDAVLVKYNSLNALPINIIQFTATPEYENNTVLCNWEVASEMNCQFYVVEKSFDGITWSELQSVTCSPFISGGEYQLLDDAPAAGLNYYRVKQVDAQWNVLDSRITMALFTFKNEEVVLFPVPASTSLNMIVDNKREQNTRICIYDAAGKMIHESNQTLLKGSNYFQLGIEDLSPGNYHINLVFENGEVIHKSFVK